MSFFETITHSFFEGIKTAFLHVFQLCHQFRNRGVMVGLEDVLSIFGRDSIFAPEKSSFIGEGFC